MDPKHPDSSNREISSYVNIWLNSTSMTYFVYYNMYIFVASVQYYLRHLYTIFVDSLDSDMPKCFKYKSISSTGNDPEFRSFSASSKACHSVSDTTALLYVHHTGCRQHDVTGRQSTGRQI